MSSDDPRPTGPVPGPEVEDVESRVLATVVGAYELAAIALGDRLGWYAALADAPRGLTAPELAAATGTQPRYVREWLEQQACAGLLDIERRDDAPERRRFSLPPAVAEILAPGDAAVQLTPFVRQAAAALRDLPLVLDAVRGDGGVPWRTHGTDAVDGHETTHQNAFLALMPQWLATMPDVDAALRRPGARVADLGLGATWGSVAIARAYPEVHVDAFDLDAQSAAAGRRAAEEHGVADRIRTQVVDAVTLADPAWPEELGATGYDLVTAFESLHDWVDPVAVLTNTRRMVSPGGAVLIMEDRVADRLAPPAGPVERLMYGLSLTLCLPDQLRVPDATAGGTVTRQDRLRGYATEAGFPGIEPLAIEHRLWRFYRLLLPGQGAAAGQPTDR